MGHSRHEQATALVGGSPEAVFAHLDDPRALGAHMNERSAMMMGGRMTYDLDTAHGQAVGSVIRMRGAMLGLALAVEEVVVERAPPVRKVWETRGPQRLVVIEAYRMGFEITPDGAGTRLLVFIDYSIPSTGLWRLLGWLSARSYARWCVRQMSRSAVAHFGEAQSCHCAPGR
jgi:hypothetical protein